MSIFFAYICTRSTVEPNISPRAVSVDQLARDVADGLSALSDGKLTVGQIALFPVQRSVPNHLLCDGSEIPKSAFPELYAYIGDSEGAPTLPDNFKLPNYLTSFAPAAAATPETRDKGTVSAAPPVFTPPTYFPEQTDQTWGDVDSGGRWRG